MSLKEVLEETFIGSCDTDTHRVCGTCGEFLPVENFYKDGKDRYGKTRYRRDCRSCYKMQRYIEAKNPKKKG